MALAGLSVLKHTDADLPSIFRSPSVAALAARVGQHQKQRTTWRDCPADFLLMA